MGSLWRGGDGEERSGVGGAKRMMRRSAGQVMIAGGEDGL